MNKELQEFLEKLFGQNMLSLGEGKEASQEEAISLIRDMVSDKASLTEQVTNLTNIHEDVGLTPDLAQWVKGPALP